MKTAIYARVSTTDQNCEIQLAELRDYAIRRGWTIVEEFVDSGLSGAKASRPALDRLMRGAARHDFDCILVTKIDRFSRSVLHLNQQVQDLASADVRFIAVTQGIDTDQRNPTTRLLLQILGAVAEFERDLIRERTKAGVALAKKKGKHCGRPRVVFDRVKAQRLRDSGLSWRDIGKRLKLAEATIRLGLKKPAA